jgi:hypothetical protein
MVAALSKMSALATAQAVVSRFRMVHKGGAEIEQGVGVKILIMIVASPTILVVWPL